MTEWERGVYRWSSRPQARWFPVGNALLHRRLWSILPAVSDGVGSPMGERAMQQLADHLKVLADPARLRILKELVGIRREKSVCVRDLADRLQISQPNVSHHLKVLKTAGFISCQKAQEKDQRFAYYCVDREKIQALFHDVIKQIA